MGSNRFQLGLVGLLVLLLAIVLTFQHRSRLTLRQQNERLLQLASDNESLSNRLAGSASPTPRLPAPHMPPATAPTPPEEMGETNLLLHIIRGGSAPKLTPAQIQHHLQECSRSVASLLAAYRSSKNTALLREAMDKYPAEPQAAFEALLSQEASPETRREWLEKFKNAAPDNALADYFSALDYFKAGRTDSAVQELVSARAKPGFTDYTMERIQADEEAFRSAGYSEAEASMAAAWGIALPQLRELRSLGKSVVDLANSYRQAGDESSCQAALQMAVGLGRQLDGPQAAGMTLVSRLVGISVQQQALSSLDPGSIFGSEPVQAQIDQLVERRSAYKNLVQQATPFYEQMTPQDWISYNRRALSLGEENAISWMLDKFGWRPTDSSSSSGATLPPGLSLPAGVWR